MSGVGSVQSAGDGYFLVDGQKMDLGALMMALQIDRTKTLDKQIADQMAEIQERNKQLKALNELMSQMRSLKAQGSDDDDFNQGWATIDGVRKPLWRTNDNWAKEFGIKWTDISGGASRKTRDAQWDANIEAIKGKIDGLNSDSQLSMIRLQALIDKRNQAFEMASNTLQKDQKTRDSIVGNFR